MPITVGANKDALRAQRFLAKHTDELALTFERLSSGMRINRASDDPGGLSIAEILGSQRMIASVAIRNANDGISLIQIADSVMAEEVNIFFRMAELAEQASTGAYNSVQRSAISLEFVALASEAERIATHTRFNEIYVTSGTQTISLQVGFNSYSTSQIAINTNRQGTLQSLGLAGAGSSRLSYSVLAAGDFESQSSARLALDAVKNAIDTLTQRRGELGAVGGRLEIAVNTLQDTRESLTAAESRIRSVDVAAEVAQMTRLQILQQAGAAVLAQANQSPAIALKLLS